MHKIKDNTLDNIFKNKNIGEDWIIESKERSKIIIVIKIR